MYAYYRMVADQTDAVAVVATPEEWREFLSSIGEVDPWLNPDSPAWKLERALKEVGIG